MIQKRIQRREAESMRAVFKKEFGGIFRRMWGYICTALVILISAAVFIYYNLSYQNENILSVLSAMSVAMALILPLYAVNAFPDRAKENTDACYDYLPLSARDVVLGKYFSAFSAALVSNIPLALYGAISGIYAVADHRASFSALLGLLLLEAALLALYMLIARKAKNRIAAYALCYTAAVLWYFVPMLSMLVPLSPMASLIAVASLLLAVAVLLFLLTKKIIVSAVVFAVSESVLCIAYLVFKPHFKGLFEHLVKEFSIFAHYNSFAYGVFNIKSVIFFLICAVLFVFLTWRSYESAFADKNQTRSLVSLRAASLLTALLLCASSAFAVCALALVPDRLLAFDATLSGKYSPSESAKEFLSTLDKEVDIYILEPTGEETYELYLDKLVSYSPRLSLKKVYAASDSDFYTQRDIPISAIGANSLIIECGERMYYVSYSSLFYHSNTELGISQMSASQYNYYFSMFSQSEQYAEALEKLLYGTSVHFDADEVICAYIEYACADIIPANYYLTGHGEADTGNSKSPYYGLGIQPLDISSTDVPADAASIFINMPTSDISESERERLSAYLSRGGQLTFITVEANLDMPNLCALLAEYGLSASKGSVKQDITENDESKPSTQIKALANTDSDVLAYFADDSSYSPIVINGNAITMNDGAKPYLTHTALLSSSSDCYIESSEKKGTYTLACSAEAPTGAKLVWFTGGEAFNGAYSDNAMSVVCALGWVSLSFESRINNMPAALYSPATAPIEAASTRLLSAALVAIPLAICACGIVCVHRRKSF